MKSDNSNISKNKGSGFKVPEGYFDSVEDMVLSKLITEKLPKKHGFSVPKGYFDALEESVHAKLKVDLVADREGFKAPEGYFGAIEDTVFAKLGKPQEVDISDVPEGYFDTLEDKVFARLKEEVKKEPKVIPLGDRLKKVWAPIAVAASFTLIFILTYNKPIIYPAIETVVVDELIEENLINLDSYEIAEVFNDTELVASEDVDEDAELLDYLNGTDVESILLEN